jgi:hypothetical protein
MKSIENPDNYILEALYIAFSSTSAEVAFKTDPSATMSAKFLNEPNLYLDSVVGAGDIQIILKVRTKQGPTPAWISILSTGTTQVDQL